MTTNLTLADVKMLTVECGRCGESTELIDADVRIYAHEIVWICEDCPSREARMECDFDYYEDGDYHEPYTINGLDFEVAESMLAGV